MKFGVWAKQNPGNIKIGAKKGTNYFYIGTSQDYIEHQEVYEAQLWDYNSYRMRKAKTVLHELSQNFPTPETYIKRNPKATAADFMKAIDQWFNDYRRRKQIYDNWADRMRTYTALQNRTVIDTYKASGFDEGYTVVIVDGAEQGSYWTADEVTKPMNFAQLREDE